MEAAIRSMPMKEPPPSSQKKRSLSSQRLSPAYAVNHWTPTFLMLAVEALWEQGRAQKVRRACPGWYVQGSRSFILRQRSDPLLRRINLNNRFFRTPPRCDRVAVSQARSEREKERKSGSREADRRWSGP